MNEHHDSQAGAAGYGTAAGIAPTRPGGSARLAPIDTDIPARLDRLPWSRFHWLLVIALGITWVLDGLEVTIVGSLGPMLTNPATLGLETHQLGLSHTLYLIGA